jgi:hypothetical protein
MAQAFIGGGAGGKGKRAKALSERQEMTDRAVWKDSGRSRRKADGGELSMH